MFNTYSTYFNTFLKEVNKKKSLKYEIEYFIW